MCLVLLVSIRYVLKEQVARTKRSSESFDIKRAELVRLEYLHHEGRGGEAAAPILVQILA